MAKRTTAFADSPAAQARRLRSGELALGEFIDQLEPFVETQQREVLAFISEENRSARLRGQAAELEARLSDPNSRPPLYGVPLGVKDIFHVEGFETRAGSRLPPGRLKGQQAPSVTRLLDAGALLVGKTVTTEFAYFAPGPTRNPRQLDHTPGGSSSGSAAAVAAGMATLALGTQTIGSIIRPAAFCGVVGFKPSYGRISRAGVIPLAPSLDHVGYFTPDCDWAKLAAGVLVDGWRSVNPSRKPVLGVPEGLYLERVSAAGAENYENTLDQLAAEGYRIRHVPAMEDFESIYARHQQILAAEAAAVHADWYSEFEPLYHPKTADLIRRGMGVPAAELARALEGRATLRNQLAALAEESGIDLWVSPSAPGPAPLGLESTGDPVMNLPWTHCGLPAINLPSGANQDGLPFGLQLIGGWQQDEALLAWAAQIEEVLADG